MERKLSQKATRIRDRFTFSLSNHARHRASTMNASGATSISNTRPRSSTTPTSSNPSENACNNPQPSRYYDFTDEPGFFLPPSPFIDRQEIDEDLEDEMKHACALLVHSIERGLPIWPSFQANVPPNTGFGCVDKPSVPGVQSQCQYQGSLVLPRDEGCDVNGDAAAEEMYDSGVAFSHDSSVKSSRSGRGSRTSSGGACAGNGRFYGNRSLASPRKEAIDRRRAKGQSFATDLLSVRSHSRSRSRSSSLALFPYSPPQVQTDTLFTTDNLTSSDNLDHNTSLGTEGLTWLRASLCEDNLDSLAPTKTSPPKPQPSISIALPDPQPRRFYSTRRLPSEQIFQPQKWAHGISSSRSTSLLDGTSTRSLSLSFDEEKRNISIHDWALRGSHGELRDNDDGRTYQIGSMDTAVSTTQPRYRRVRASRLLRRLVGIRRRDGGDFGDSGRVRAVAVAG